MSMAVGEIFAADISFDVNGAPRETSIYVAIYLGDAGHIEIKRREMNNVFVSDLAQKTSLVDRSVSALTALIKRCC